MLLSRMASLDQKWIVRKMPADIRKLCSDNPMRIAIAGGYIRSLVEGEAPNDIDIFSASTSIAENCAMDLAFDRGIIEDKTWAKMKSTPQVFISPNAITIRDRKPTVQFIRRWTYAAEEEPDRIDLYAVMASFDFSIAQCIMAYREESPIGWNSLVHPDFYPALAAKRLEYTFPIRHEEAGGSMLRLLKFAKRGYYPTLKTISGIMTRVYDGIDFEKVARAVEIDNMTRAEAIQCAVNGLLEEVDPSAVDDMNRPHYMD